MILQMSLTLQIFSCSVNSCFLFANKEGMSSKEKLRTAGHGGIDSTHEKTDMDERSECRKIRGEKL